MFPPQPPTPAPPSAPPPLADLPMSADDVGLWWTRVELAIEARKVHAIRWDALLKAYLPSDNPEAINSNTHFRNTEQKKAQLFFKSPELTLTALEPLKDQVQGPDGAMHTSEDIVTIKQAVINKLLGRDGVNLKRLMDEVLFDVLQPAGMSPTKICYEADFVTVTETVQDGEAPMEGSVLGLQTVPKMKEVEVEVPIHEEWTWKRFSPMKLLIPHDWRSTRYDEAPWIGMQFVKSLELAKREYHLPDDFEGNATTDRHVFDSVLGKQDGATSAEMVEGVEIWYRPAFYGSTQPHRQIQHRLVLLKDQRTSAAKHTRSPYQDLGPDGRLTPDSMIGFPIHVCTLRDLSDSAYIPSDAAMTDPLVRQENTWASQDIKLRDANIPRFLFDGSIAEAIKKLATADVGDGAEVETGKLLQGIDSLVAALPHLEKAASDVQGRAAIQQLINQTLALGPTQSGSVNTKVLSATEISNAQQTANTRAEAEQARALDFVLDGVRKFDALIVRYADSQDYVQWVGQDGTKRLNAWNGKMLAGRFAYDAKPDSQLRIDLAQQRQQDIQFVNLMANAPEANRAELLRGLARDFGKDAAKIIQPAPAKTPEPPKINLSFSGADMGDPVVLSILEQQGVKIDQTTIGQRLAMVQGGLLPGLQAPPAPNAETSHGGPLEGSGDFSPVSKHASQVTGQRPGPRTM